MDSALLKKIIVNQAEYIANFQSGIKREVLSNVNRFIKQPKAIIISGIRRCGKSTFLRQVMDLLKNDYYYFNFEDEKLLDFTVADFAKLHETFIELYGEKRYFFFDEIQNIPQWERFVRRMVDQGSILFVTGSNASLLSRELGTKLTGRHFDIILYPFSFKEFLDFYGYKIGGKDFYLTAKRAKLKKYFQQYLLLGGMPEYLKQKTEESLKRTYTDILYRDIIVRYGLTNEKILRELAFYLLSNTATYFTYNSLKNFLHLGSMNTAKKYVEYLENSYLFFILDRYSPSLKIQQNSPKKIYCIDNGLINKLAFQFSKNQGKFLENVVFLELKRRSKEIFYYKEKRECDFIIRKGISIIGAIQVTKNLNDSNKDREIEGLLEAMECFSLNEGLILTLDEEDEFKFKKYKIKVMPVWQWLLE